MVHVQPHGIPIKWGCMCENKTQQTSARRGKVFHFEYTYVVCSKSFRTFEIARQLNVLAMSGKLCCLVVCFLIIILFAMSSCYD
jgi:hypothetical protein